MSRKSKGVVVSNDGGRARARWTYGGVRRAVALGPVTDPGAVQRSLARLHARLAVDPGYSPAGERTDYTVAELIADYTRASTLTEPYRHTYRLLVAGYGTVPVSSFGPVAFADWLAACVRERKWCRESAKKARRHVLVAWRWAVSRERVEETRYAALMTAPVPRDAARSRVVAAAPIASIRAALPFLPAPARALCLVQLACGARPSELFRLTPGDLIRSGEYQAGGETYPVPVGQWVHVVDKSKTGRPRVLFFGPSAIEVLAPLCEGRPKDRCLFRPRESTHARGKAGESYSAGGYRQALHRACERAGVPKIDPYQIRHRWVARVRVELSPDHAQAGAGHASPVTTAGYARGTLDARRASEAAGLPGVV